jgi:hypothetical protein
VLPHTANTQNNPEFKKERRSFFFFDRLNHKERKLVEMLVSRLLCCLVAPASSLLISFDQHRTLVKERRVKFFSFSHIASVHKPL